MAFFSGLSSSIGKKLLLYGLRQIDILDKDPTDFVNVDVGKKTTLEVRDVGLHVKKLVALLQLKLPTELHLLEAKASLFRVTFVLDFGVPQISIEIDGIHVQASLANTIGDVEAGPQSPQSKPRSTAPRQPASQSASQYNVGDNSSDDDEHVLTLDELANSFIKAEPAEEIRELEQELGNQSAYLQESVALSDAGSEDGSAMGAPLGLPAYLRNILNTALDRLTITINAIDIEVEDQTFELGTGISRPERSSPATLKFFIERIAIGSEEPHDTLPTHGPLSGVARVRSGISQRKLHVHNIFARLISDVEDFVSTSRVSQPNTPTKACSEISMEPLKDRGPSECPAPVVSEPSPEENVAEEVLQINFTDEASRPVQAPTTNVLEESFYERQSISPKQTPLTASVRTIDEDRFADASSDGDLTASYQRGSPIQFSHDTPFGDLGGSSILYDDEGILDYAMQNSMLGSRFDDTGNLQTSSTESLVPDGVVANHQQQSHLSNPASDASISTLPTVSALGRSFRAPEAAALLADPVLVEPAIVDEIISPKLSNAEGEPVVDSAERSLTPTLSAKEDLAESQIFNHDDDESMYMSAISAQHSDSAPGRAVPGGWDSSSTSSKATSDQSGSIPDEMISGSILAPHSEANEGFATPRPGSPSSRGQSPSVKRDDIKASEIARTSKQAKTFLSIDDVVVWFPLGLQEHEFKTDATEISSQASEFDFKPPNLGDDSIFAEMPGSFSNYAHSSSHRQRPSAVDSSRRRGPTDDEQFTKLPERAKVASTPSVKVDVGSIAGHMDLSTGRILFRMFGQVFNALTDVPSSHVEQSKTSVQATDASSNVELSVQHVSIAWLENISAESPTEGYTFDTKHELSPLEAILRINLSRLHVTSQSRRGESRAKLQVGEFILACLDQEIIAFSKPRPRSKRLTSNPSDQLESDVEIDYEQKNERRITVVTRPVKAIFDLQKLDDALSCFGGFSGVLELSSSMSSTSTVQSPIISPLPPKPRGVHFGDGRSTVAAKVQNEVPSSPKIQIQTGEVSFILKSRSCAVQLQTTSIRAALRASNVRLKVSEIKISGPYIESEQTGSPLVIDVRSTTVNFLFAPEERDLARLISMITPSKNPYENNDDILIDTLLRQRRKGSVLRVEVGELGVRMSDLQQMKAFEALGAELARLSKVTKYLPDDDRPGLLSLGAVQKLDARIAISEQLGEISIELQDAAVAHIGVPALLAAEIGQAVVRRGDEILVHEVIQLRPQDRLPAIMLRLVGDEMEPIAKAKLFNVCAEYRVTTIMAALGISEIGSADDIALSIASSVATLTAPSSPKTLSQQSSEVGSQPTNVSKPLQIDLLLRSCAIGLNPYKLSSKGLFVLTEAHIVGKQVKSNYTVTLELRKASMHAIDDVGRLDAEHVAAAIPANSIANRHLHELQEYGYVSLSSISAAKIFVNITGGGKDQPQLVNVEFKNELFVLESCADSTQTLIAILNGLQPPLPPSPAEKYRTVVPLQQMMESFTGDAIAPHEDYADENFMNTADLVEDELPTNLEFVGSIYNSQSLPTDEDMGDSLLGQDDLGVLATPQITRQRGDRALLESFQEKYEISEAEKEFDFTENYFEDPAADRKGKARKWDSAKNQYHLSNEFKAPDAPLKVRVRDVNIIWNLFDGYDWPRTRSIISQAVDDVEARAEERRQKARDDDDDDDFVEEDFLFNSVWIGVPVKDEKGALARRINHDIDDLASETGSYATSTATRSTGATVRPRSATISRRRLKLGRSRHKKIAFSLMGVAVDLVVFPPNTGETINSIDVRVRDLEIFDHVPTSTWKKFITCAIDPNERELYRPMVNLQLLTVKPVTDLAASELVIKVTLLPLRLHVDQDALDFITRFFEFKDDAEPDTTSPSEQPFIQRLEVMAVHMKLDYKPKRVDYRGLRSGHTTEFKNFLILDGSDIVLRHAIVYGITSFDKLHKTLNDVWVPDVISNQLPGVLSGLAAVRPLVNVGSGIRDLVVIPMREYKKDGRIVRSLQKGVYAFAKNTTSEVARLGAKVAIGTQNILEGAETFLNPQAGSPSRQPHHDWDGEDPNSDTEEPRAVSHYANQPIGVRAGLRSAARYLERDLLTARDAVIAIPAEIMEEGSGVGMAKAFARHAPTVVLRPALGATKALSNALLGVGNALDSSSRRKIEDKYKSY
ncbi:autophagy-related protein 2 [Coniothyrium glycines]